MSPHPVFPSSSHGGSRTPLPGMDATGSRAGVGAPGVSQQHLLPLGLLRAAGHWFSVGALFEPCQDSPPQPLGWVELRDIPTLWRAARERLFPAACGAWGCQAEPSLAPEQPARHRSCDRRSPCPFPLAAEVKRNYFSHSGRVLGEQIPAQLHLSC